MQERTNIIETFKDLGLSKSESTVYLSMLTLGSTTIMKIAEHAGIRRTTVYPLLENLQKKGLIRVEVRGFKTSYAPEDPKTLEAIIERKHEKVRGILPKLEAMYNLEGGESFIKYYEGIEGVRNVYEDLLADLYPHEEYLVFGDPDRWSLVNSDFYKQFIKKRIKIPLDAKMLLVYSPTAERYKQTEQNYGEEVRLLPPGVCIETNVVITPRKLIIQQMIEPILVIVIENKSTIKLQRELFYIIWDAQSNAEQARE